MLADAAPLEPEKVQLVALLTRFAAGGAVTAGAAAGSATGEQLASPAIVTRSGMIDVSMVETTGIKTNTKLEHVSIFLLATNMSLTVLVYILVLDAHHVS